MSSLRYGNIATNVKDKPGKGHQTTQVVSGGDEASDPATGNNSDNLKKQNAALVGADCQK